MYIGSTANIERNAVMKFFFKTRKRIKSVTLDDLRSIQPWLVDAQVIEPEATEHDDFVNSAIPPIYRHVMFDILKIGTGPIYLNCESVVGVINLFNRMVRDAVTVAYDPLSVCRTVVDLYDGLDILTLLNPGFEVFASVLWEIITPIRTYRTSDKDSDFYGMLFTPYNFDIWIPVWIRRPDRNDEDNTYETSKWWCYRPEDNQRCFFHGRGWVPYGGDIPHPKRPRLH